MTASAATATLAAFAVAGHRPSADRTAMVGRILVDTLGSALAATGTPAEQIVSRWASRERTQGGSTIWSSGEQVSAALAATVNGHAGHILDWDDVSPTMPMHPSCVLVPALLAVAESRGLSGPSVVTAHDVGASVFRAVAQALPHGPHYARGWHTTSTVGRLAATAALASLCGLDEERAAHALGIAASSAAGSLANFGSMTKAWHSGQAARDAVLAVELAEDGFTARRTQLEDPLGFFAMYGDADGGQHELGDLLEHWREQWPTDWAVKRYPACYATHRAIDATLALRRDVGAADVTSIDIQVAPGDLRPLIGSAPTTGTEAKFSLEYVVAVAMLHGEVRLHHFDDEEIDDPQVRRLMSLVAVTETASPTVGPGSGSFAVVTLHGTGGPVERRVDHTYGDSRDPLSEADLLVKLVDGSARAGLDESTAATWADHLFGLPGSAAGVTAGPTAAARQNLRSAP